MKEITRRAAGRLIGAGTVGFMWPITTSRASPPVSSFPMLMRAIPSSGEKLPVIGLGTWQTFDVGSSQAERQPLEQVLSLFWRLGGRVIDSSPMYARSEEVIGDLAKKLQLTQLFLATKSGRVAKKRGSNQSNVLSRGCKPGTST